MLLSKLLGVLHLERAVSAPDSRQLALTPPTLLDSSSSAAAMLLPRVALATITTTLMLCPSSAQILPPPHDNSMNSPSNPPTVKVTYHQGLVSSNGSAITAGVCDAQPVSSGVLAAGSCIGLQTYALTIARVSNMECAFRLFRGSNICEADATETVSLEEFVVDGRTLLICVHHRSTFQSRAERETSVLSLEWKMEASL